MINFKMIFPDNFFKTIYADPPWPERGGGKIKRGADRHYDLMSIKEIINLKNDVKRISNENSHLYLWVTNNYLESGLLVMKEWGFQYKTCITWLKDRIGLGQYFRGITEHCLFGVRGNIPYKIIDGKRCQGSTIIISPKKEHSEKPKELYDMIELVSVGPFLELFARNYRENWYSWGNEII